jgi:hypothetical protein
VRLIACTVLVASMAPATAAVIREERSVTVGSVRERWRLVWNSEPKPACAPDDGMQLEWFTCPCAGFAFGERGDLDLVRVKPGGAEERRSLTAFFEEEIDSWGRTAILPRWPRRDTDVQAVDRETPEQLTSKIHSRPIVSIMNLRDFDHDGRATEFFLQTSAAPCGKRMGIVVGVSRGRPALHAFGSALNPAKPLVLRADHWDALAKSASPADRVDWACGDHGSDTQEELTLRADSAGVHVTRHFYQCNADCTRGSLLRSEEQ